MMKLTDMDMLQDYEKDTRMAALAYTLAITEVMDPTLRRIFQNAANGAVKSQKKFADAILKFGDRP